MPSLLHLEGSYYAVIFTSTLRDSMEDYHLWSEMMNSKAKEYKGFLGMESARSDIGISVSYWRDLGSIHKWKSDADHAIAQKLGREKWYSAFTVRIARVERAYGFDAL